MRKALLIIMFTALAFLPPGAWLARTPAQPQSPPGQGTGRVLIQQQESFDVVLLMDSSGSMKKTDPHDYRKPAARLFISLLRENDRVGIISFGDSAEVLAPLTNNTKEHRDLFAAAIDRISSKELSTNIPDALKKGLDDLGRSSTRNKIMVLMSDGKLALGSPEQDAAALAALNGMLPRLKAAGIRIYSIAFTDLADKALLERVARETGGFAALAATDKDIHVIFASLFEKIKAPDALPLEGNTFRVDRDVQETILLITKAQGTRTALTDPAGAVYNSSQPAPNMQWYVSPLFDMITVQHPAPGAWTVQLSSREGNKVFIITDLTLASSFSKGFVTRGEVVRVDVWLEKHGVPLQDREVLDQVAITGAVAQTADAGLQLRFSGQDRGRYHAEFTAATSGDSALRITAESKTFKREKTFAFRVVEPPAGTVAPAPVLHDEVSWTRVFVRFGIINAGLLLIVGAGALLRSARRRRAQAPAEPQTDTPGETP